MATLEAFVHGRRTNAALAWGVVAAVVVAAGRFLLTVDLLWAGTAGVLLAVALVPAAVTRDPTAAVPWELFGLAALPVVARAVGLGVHTAPFLAAAGVALLLAVDLDAFTSLEMTARFAVVFVVIGTLAFAGLWAVAAWGADAALGTDYLSTVDELMWDLVVAAATGVFAGVVFELYFRRVDPAGGAFREADPDGESESEDEDHPTDGPTAADGRAANGRADGAEASDGHDLPRLAVRGMQLALAGVAAFGLARGEFGLVFNSVAPLAVTFLPALLRREAGYAMSPWLVLWLTVAAVLHAGGAVGLYKWLGWYDQVAHAVSGALVAGTGYAVARAVELHTDDVSFNPAFRGGFVVLFVLAVGVLWEVMEFSTGLVAGVLGGKAVLAQYGLGDIALDLAANTVGGVLVAVAGTDRFRRLVGAIGGRATVLGEREGG